MHGGIQVMMMMMMTMMINGDKDIDNGDTIFPPDMWQGLNPGQPPEASSGGAPVVQGVMMIVSDSDTDDADDVTQTMKALTLTMVLSAM